jgi:hypothetical protein
VSKWDGAAAMTYSDSSDDKDRIDWGAPIADRTSSSRADLAIAAVPSLSTVCGFGCIFIWFRAADEHRKLRDQAEPVPFLVNRRVSVFGSSELG